MNSQILFFIVVENADRTALISYSYCSPLERDQFKEIDSFSTNFKLFTPLTMQPELKTLELNTLNPERLICISNVKTYDFLNPRAFGTL